MSVFTLERGSTGTKSGSVSKLNSLDGVLFIGDSITEGLRQEVEDNNTYTLSQETKEALQNSLFLSEVATTPEHWLQAIKEGKLRCHDRN